MQKSKIKTDLMIYLVAIFSVSVVCQLIPYVSFAFSSKLSKLPSPLLPLRKRDLCQSSL